MKLILRLNSGLVKVYTEEMTFSAIEKFAKEQFKLKEDTIQMTFQDDEGDTITVLSNEELEIMLEVFKGRTFVEVNVEGINKKEEEIIEVKATDVQPIVVSQPENLPKPIESKPQEKDRKSRSKSKQHHCEERRKRREQRREMRDKKDEERKKQNSGSKGSPSPRNNSPPESFETNKKNIKKMEELLNGMVTRLVDQRINHLLPCLKEKILKGEDGIIPITSEMVHKGFECKGCNSTPITGIRFECPKCPDFNLCEQCEQKIDHEHNLLKIKKTEVEKTEDDNYKLFQRFFTNLGKRCQKRDSSSSHEKDRCHKRWRGHHLMKKLWGLSFLFGGEPDQYREFVDSNPEMRPRETFKKYADENGVPEEEFKKRLANLRCQKLSRLFGKDPEHYKAFVEENIELNQRELVGSLYDQGIEKRDNKKCWWGQGRFFNFRDACKPEEGSINSQQKVEFQVSASMLVEPKPLDKPEVVREKGAILQELMDIFGAQYKIELVKHIDKHFNLGKEEICNLWIKSICGK